MDHPHGPTWQPFPAFESFPQYDGNERGDWGIWTICFRSFFFKFHTQSLSPGRYGLLLLSVSTLFFFAFFLAGRHFRSIGNWHRKYLSPAGFLLLWAKAPLYIHYSQLELHFFWRFNNCKCTRAILCMDNLEGRVRIGFGIMGVMKRYGTGLCSPNA